jgi:hypothetical protein
MGNTTTAFAKLTKGKTKLETNRFRTKVADGSTLVSYDPPNQPEQKNI